MVLERPELQFGLAFPILELEGTAPGPVLVLEVREVLRLDVPPDVLGEEVDLSLA